jgi:geranylgeranyl pyrophosphate synthase
MRDSSARFAPNRVAESWFQAARETAGAATVLATQLGSIVAGGQAPVRDYGIDLGTATRLAEEVVDLVVGPEAHHGRRGDDLRRGIYSLPVLYAIEVDAELPQLLAQHTAGDVEAAEVVAAVERTGAVARACEECERRVDAAVTAAEEMAAGPGEVLLALARVPREYLASTAPGPILTADAVESLGAI